MRRFPRFAAALAGLILLVTAIGACQASAPAPAKAPTGGTTSPIATSQDVVAASAVVAPYRQAALGIKTGGRVTEIGVTSGNAVTQEQPLAKVDARDLEQRNKESEARLRSTQASPEKARAGIRSQEIAALEAAIAIAEAGVTTAGDAAKVAEGNLAATQAEAKSDEGAVEAAQGNVTAAQAAQACAQAVLDKIQAGPTRLQPQVVQKV